MENEEYNTDAMDKILQRIEKVEKKVVAVKQKRKKGKWLWSSIYDGKVRQHFVDSFQGYPSRTLLVPKSLEKEAQRLVAGDFVTAEGQPVKTATEVQAAEQDIKDKFNVPWYLPTSTKFQGFWASKGDAQAYSE